MILRLLGLLAVCALLCAPAPATARNLASLVADQIAVTDDGTVTASGNVEVFFEGTRLTASEVLYTRDGDQLIINGPIRVTEPDGSVFIAEQAELSPSLSEGILTSARLVLNDRLQLAADSIARVGPRYTRLDRVLASSCQVCETSETPLWEIRATGVIHDQERQQLFFENAQLRVAGLPVFYLPRLRLPDPTLKRATGFLIPQLRTSSNLGTGLKLPYFVVLGDHADATLTPYISTSTTTLEFSYRHEIPKGKIQVLGAGTYDDIDGRRGYIFANAAYRLPQDFIARTQLEFVSDPGYLFVYDYSSKDRLTNQFSLTRVRNNDRFLAAATEFRSLRDSEIEISDTLPDRFLEVIYQRDIPELSFGGRAVATVQAAALNRPSSEDILGRDSSRIGMALDWRRDWQFGPGLIAAAETGLSIDAYSVGQDSTYATTLTRVVPRAAAELRWPLRRDGPGDGYEILEPVLRLDVASAGGNDVPLEDSRVVEFDEGNLFSASRYPGVDGVEDGARIALGVTWRRRGESGWVSDLALGRLAHLNGDLGFAEGSGLVGDRSEWLLAARVGLDRTFWIANRSLFSEDLDFTLSETRLIWRGKGWSLNNSYIFAQPEPAEGREDDLTEWSFRGNMRLNESWEASANWRYDFEAGRAARTGLGLGYRTECVDLSLSLSRRYASSTSVDPTTDFGFRVSLTGFGGNDAGAPRRTCRG